MLSGVILVSFEHYFTLCCGVSIVNFEHVIAGWVIDIFDQLYFTQCLYFFFLCRGVQSTLCKVLVLFHYTPNPDLSVSWLLYSTFGVFKVCVRYFYQIFIFQQMIALQKLCKMFFISSEKPFSFSRYSNFSISVFPSFSLSAIALEVDQR